MKRYLRFISLLLLVFLPCSASSTSVGLNDKTLPFSHYPLSFSEAYESVATDHKTLFYRLPPQTEVCRLWRQTLRPGFIRLPPQTEVCCIFKVVSCSTGTDRVCVPLAVAMTHLLRYVCLMNDSCCSSNTCSDRYSF